MGPTRGIFVTLLFSISAQAHICEDQALKDALETHRQSYLAKGGYTSPPEFAANPDLYRGLFPKHGAHMELVEDLEEADDSLLTPLLRGIKASFAPAAAAENPWGSPPKARLEGDPRFVALDTETTGFLPWDRLTEIALVPINEKFQRDGNSKTLSLASYLDASELPIALLRRSLNRLNKLDVVVSPEQVKALIGLASQAILDKNEDDEWSLQQFIARFPEFQSRDADFTAFVEMLGSAFSRFAKAKIELTADQIIAILEISAESLSNARNAESSRQTFISRFAEFEARTTEFNLLFESIHLVMESLENTRMISTVEELKELIKLSAQSFLQSADGKFSFKELTAHVSNLKSRIAELAIFSKSLKIAFDRQTALTLNHYLDGIEAEQRADFEPSETERVDSELAMARKVAKRFLRYLAQPQLPILIGQNLAFDMPKITQMLERAYDVSGDQEFRIVSEALPRFQVLDTKLLIKIMWGRLLFVEYWITRDVNLKPLSSAKGEFMADLFQVNRDKWHGALFDSLATVEMLKHNLALDLDLADRLQSFAQSEPARYQELRAALEEIDSKIVLKNALEYATHPYHVAHKKLYDADHLPPQEPKKPSKPKENDQQGDDFSQRLHLKSHPIPWAASSP